VDHLAAGDREIDPRAAYLAGRDGEDVTAEHRDVRPAARPQRPELRIAVVDVGDAGREGGERLCGRDGFLREERLLRLCRAWRAQLR
jgi:hypothetical protein